jgi:hypothetical protein
MKSRGKIAVDSVGQGRPRTQNADRQPPRSRRPCCGLQLLRRNREPGANRRQYIDENTRASDVTSYAELLSDDLKKDDEAEPRTGYQQNDICSGERKRMSAGTQIHRNTPTTTEAGARKTSERYLSKRVQHAKVSLADYGLRSWESSVRSPSIKHLHTAVKIHAMARPLHYSAMGIAQHNIHDSEHTVSYR